MDSSPSLSSIRLSRSELAVFVSGVVSMGLEILAGRMIAPEFGSSIYTWGSLIGVFLAALSLGYHRGGKRAATHASTSRLVGLFLLSALYVAGLILFGDLLLQATAGLPLPSRFASIPGTVLLFGPPTYLLGYVSPYAAELSGQSDVGAASGHVYAVGTVGSIVGAFATTFLLIPTMSTSQIGLLFGLLSVGTAVALAVPNVDRDEAFWSLGITLVLLVAGATGSVGLDIGGDVVYETQTAYQELRVVDSGGTRTLYLDGQPHSAMDKNDPTRHVFEYTSYFHAPYLFTDEGRDIDRVLFVGGGGFTGPRAFLDTYPNVTVDVVEIDPEVVRVAKEYFAVEESERLTIHTMGGRQYLQQTDETYDLIVLDAYKKDKVPFQLTTVEFMQLADERLDDDGILFANVISAPSGPASQFYRAEYKTMQQVFPQVYSFPTAGGVVVQNIEVVATKRDTLVTREELQARNRQRDVGIDLSAQLTSYRNDEPTDDVPVLRDDRAPVDSLLDPMVGQRYVVVQSNESTADGETERRGRVTVPVPVGAGTVPVGVSAD
ncbi:Predicted spermidine synthase with an N-terminal membrane domain [Halogranum rubrum]|uniref:Polyamine aminopropyltransferase n=1 Tax=Halogranum rubrum TaxID=553466 RepID=A0A1I4CA24_9EURY|nr:fused MFS/spermidine synthase [Halogranum rubrum]SFK77982.1 Predicted spermidine synthase with an N-terminal membrane domain [Halogranum rubrum]